jgi:hypothetical protein
MLKNNWVTCSQNGAIVFWKLSRFNSYLSAVGPCKVRGVFFCQTNLKRVRQIIFFANVSNGKVMIVRQLI